MKHALVRYLSIIFISVSLIIISGGSTNAPKPVKVKNVILLIGDGMGLSQVFAAMLYSKEKLNIEKAHYIGLTKTYSSDKDVTDSGASGTALAAGHKTYNGAIGVDTSQIPVKNIREYAEEAGKSTGIVVTCNLTHATPACFLVHENFRYSYNQIAMEISSTDAEILIGGGTLLFDSVGASEKFLKRGFDVVYSLDSIKNNNITPTVCFSAKDHLPTMIQGRGNFLPEATHIALQKLKLDNDGFFLMVEGSQIDWGGHSNDLRYIETEVLDFDKAVGVAMDFADKNSGTLVVIVADHETGGLTFPADTNGNLTGRFSTSDHSGIMVPVYAYGKGAELFTGIMENTDVFSKMMQCYGFNY